MRTKFSLTFYCILFSIFYVQGQKDYKGVVLDAVTKEILPYVNIGIVGKGVGTVSDEEGMFHLEINPATYTENDTLLISAIGYKRIKYAVSKLAFAYNEYPTILMQPELLELTEVIVTNKGGFPVEKEVGYKSQGSTSFGYWSDDIAQGGELGTRISVKKGLRKLERFSFEVKGNPSDSVLVRVNVYDTDGPRNFPQTKLNTSQKEIFYTIRKNSKFCDVDLKPFQIYVKDDFIVSLELLKVYGTKKISLILSASDNSHTDSYRKYASQGSWERLENSAMAYTLETTYYSKKKPKPNKARGKKNKEVAVRSVSGFVFFAGLPQTKVKITNLSTGNQVNTNENGRYRLEGKPEDILVFEALGMKKRTISLLEKTIVNVTLERE
ncbi:carboxypeptidase-like regulatory domain-containing protein [Maribacter sp.]|nr:carboxypeptidase-like regulatory domain-containing protein [Maribacter sp.]